MRGSNLPPGHRTSGRTSPGRAFGNGPVAPTEVSSVELGSRNDHPSEFVELRIALPPHIPPPGDKPPLVRRVAEVRAHSHDSRVHLNQVRVRDAVVTERRHPRNGSLPAVDRTA